MNCYLDQNKLMLFRQVLPSSGLKRYIEYFWIVESEDSFPVVQKIIPDGFTEVIFHYGDPYEINIRKAWEVQPKSVVAGQIKKFFFLKNTGRSKVVGIKFKPAALAQIFGLDMGLITDNVIALQECQNDNLTALGLKVRGLSNYDSAIQVISNYLDELIPEHKVGELAIERAVGMIFQTKGIISVNELCKKLFLTERQLERTFKFYIGLSPKFYSRVIRFHQIFKLMKEQDKSWISLALEAGYYDQSHFIRNFKSFTGDDPTQYPFHDQNMANFFLMRKL
jgi:AraC-like DNA-binding protein